MKNLLSTGTSTGDLIILIVLLLIDGVLYQFIKLPTVPMRAKLYELLQRRYVLYIRAFSMAFTLYFLALVIRYILK